MKRSRPVQPGAAPFLSRALASAQWLAAVGAAALSAYGQPFQLHLARPDLDRWMYPHNATPGSRPAAAVFGTLGDEAGVDARHGQFLLGFDTAPGIPANRGPGHYLITSARVTVTVSRDRTFVYDPTPDPLTSFFPPGESSATEDPDPGRPLEMFGVGYRHDFTAETFLEDSPFGSAAAGERNAFATAYGPEGLLIDVGNSVGKTNAAFPVFEATPFALGQALDLSPADPVPAGTTVTFDLNLHDPLVVQYLQQSCHQGRLRLMLTSLQESSFGGGAPTWPEFFTRESVLGTPPTLALEGVAIRPEDSDGDGLPDDWETFHFESLQPSANADPDGDGQDNLAEFHAGTDPRDEGDCLGLTVLPDEPVGEWHLSFRYAASRRYTLQVSADLLTWQPADHAVLTYQVGQGGAEWTLPRTGPVQFLRATVEPATDVSAQP